MKDVLIGITCVLILTLVAVLEKNVMSKHDVINVSLSRLFYMILMVMIVIIIMDPKVLTSRALNNAFKDPRLVGIGMLTSIGALMYYWLLKSNDLNIVVLMYPVIMILTILSSCYFNGEKLNNVQWIGVFMTFIGLCLALAYKTH